MFKKLFRLILHHKFIFSIVVVALVGGGYWGYGKLNANENEIKYVLGAVTKGTLIASISGSGQISVTNQVDIKPKAAGDLLDLKVQNGQEVQEGDFIAQVDARDALKTVRDAVANLTSAKLSLEKLKQPASDYSILQSENSLESARTSL